MVAISAPLKASLTQIPRHVVNKSATTQQAALTSSKGDLLAEQQRRITLLYRRLQGLGSLLPDEESNAVFTDLVDYVVKTQIPKPDQYKLMQLPKMASICDDTRRMCAEAETLLEEHWSRQLTSGESHLSDFPYHSNYISLTRMEYHLLCGQGARPQHVMFIGSGPLPLSSLTLASRHIAKDWATADWSIVNVDICPRANRLGSSFTGKVFPELKENVSFMTCDAARISPSVVGKVDIIYLAALVGLDMKSKQDVIRNLVKHMKPGSRLLLRSVTGLRRLLYPDVDEAALLESSKGLLELEVVCHPRNFVINSVVIARRI